MLRSWFIGSHGFFKTHGLATVTAIAFLLLSFACGLTLGHLTGNLGLILRVNLRVLTLLLMLLLLLDLRLRYWGLIDWRFNQLRFLHGSMENICGLDSICDWSRFFLCFLHNHLWLCNWSLLSLLSLVLSSQFLLLLLLDLQLLSKSCLLLLNSQSLSFCSLLLFQSQSLCLIFFLLLFLSCCFSFLLLLLQFLLCLSFLLLLKLLLCICICLQLCLLLLLSLLLLDLSFPRNNFSQKFLILCLKSLRSFNRHRDLRFEIFSNRDVLRNGELKLLESLCRSSHIF